MDLITLSALLLVVWDTFDGWRSTGAASFGERLRIGIVSIVTKTLGDLGSQPMDRVVFDVCNGCFRIHCGRLAPPRPPLLRPPV